MSSLPLPPHRAPADLLDRAMRRASAPRERPTGWSPSSGAVGAVLGAGAVLAVQFLQHAPLRPPATAATPPTAAAAAAMLPDAQPVRFVVYAPEAREVHVAGSWTGWRADEVVLHRGADGYFSSTVTVPAGEHEYQLVIDGRWLADPAAPLSRDDGFGRRNSVLVL